MNIAIEWYEIDVMRIMFDHNVFVWLHVDEMSTQTPIDVRNYLLYRIGHVNTNILWNFETLPIKLELLNWLRKLKENQVAAYANSETFECIVFFELFPQYLVESNVRNFVANFLSFTRLPKLFYICFAISNRKLAKTNIYKLFNVDTSIYLDECIQQVCDKCTGQRIPSLSDMLEIAEYFNSLARKFNKNTIPSFRNRRLPILLSFPRQFINTLLLLLFDIRCSTDKSSLYYELIGICDKYNSKNEPVLNKITKPPVDDDNSGEEDV